MTERRADYSAPCPLTQERLWVLERIGCPGLSHAVLLRIGGPVDKRTLASALSLLWANRPHLHLTFATLRGKLHYGLAESPNLNEKVLTGADGVSAFEKIIVDSLSEPFDLENGPLYRATLIANGPERFLLLQAHAILLSSEQLLATVDTLAEACAGAPNSCSFMTAAPRALVAEVADRWRVRLQGNAGALHLPRKTAHFAGAPEFRSHAFEIPAEICARLQDIADRQQTSLATALLTASLTVLCRSSGQGRLTIGCAPHDVLAPPTAAGGEPLPIPLTTLPNDSFLDRMHRTKAVLEGCAGEEPPPLALLYRTLQVPAPLFETTFDFTHDRPRRWPAGSMVFTRENTLPSLAPGCGIGLSFQATAEQVVGRFCFRTDLYDETLVRRVSGQLLSLLASVAANPKVPLEAESPLSSEERATLLGTWNDTAHAYPRDVPVHDLIRSAARQHRQAIAVQSGDDTLTYAELDASSNAVAHHLRAAGVGPGDVVGLCMERSHHLVVGLVGIMKAGAAYLPLDPGHPAERLAFVISDAALSFVVTDGAAQDNLPSAVCRLALPLPPRRRTDDVGSAANATHPAYVIYTSGSTGQPKGVLTSHRSLVNRLVWMQSHYAITARDCFFQKTNFLFDVSVWEFLLPLISGARLVIARPGGERDPDYLHAAITHFGVTVVHFVPSALHAFLRATPSPLPDSVRLVVASGEALPAKLAREFLHRNQARLENLYGPTEAAIDVSSHSVSLDDEEPVPIGRPIWNTRLYILDTIQRPTAIGVAGELYIGGDGLAIGYLNRPDLTESRFLSDPFAGGASRMYRTGDIARWNEAGEIEYLGRADDQVKVNGFRIELEEIATVTERHQHVSRAAALVIGEAESRRIVLFVAGETPLTTVDDKQIRDHLADYLPRYMMPTQIIPLDHLPLTSNGKLDRAKLATFHSSADTGSVQVEDDVALDRALLDDLASEWTRLSGAPFSNDLLDGGATSLDAVELAAMVQGRYGVPFSLADVYVAPTFVGIASLVRSRGGSAPKVFNAGVRNQTVEGWI